MNNSKLKVTRNASKAVPFGKLDIGEVFEDSNLDRVLIKIEPLRIDSDFSPILRNAIDLESGYAYRLLDDDRVFRFKATLMED